MKKKYNKTSKNWKTRECQTCGKTFLATDYEVNKRNKRFCSVECKTKSGETSKRMKGNEHAKGTPSWNKGLMGYKSGEDNNNWKGGVTNQNDKIRKSKENKDWAKEVYRNGRYECWKCGKHCREDITAHHLLPFDDYVELRFEPSNGIVLCRSCHLKVHQKLRKQNKILKELCTQYNATSSLNFS